MKGVLTPSAEMSVGDAAIQKKIYGSGAIAKNEKMEDIMKIVKSLEESGLLTKEISGTIKNEVKEQRTDFFQFY